MQLVKLITPKIIKTLHCFSLTILVVFLSALTPVYSQDNSPYSRFGIGDLTPTSNIIGRSMGGISAGYSDIIAINFNNPASYSSFQTYYEAKSKKLTSGRAVLDIGVDFEGRTLREYSPPKKFVANNALFSYLQIGMPLKKNWGISFGLRPLSRISYKISRNERLKDPVTGLPIDSANTTNEGDGGSYLASIGTGFSLFSKQRGKYLMEEKLSVGFNAGYLFGEKDYSTRRVFINDSVEYYQANYKTRTNFGSIYLNAGIQYKFPIDQNKRISLTLGAFGNLGQQINASQDIIRETFAYDDNLGQVSLDSISVQSDIKGKIKMPSSYTLGFVLQKPMIIEKDRKEAGWVVGMDFSTQNWSNYRFYEQKDSVRNSWELRVGGQLNPVANRNYFSNISYRAGFFIGPDYINVGQKLSRFGASFGMGLPIAGRQALNQYTLINIGLQYIKRGNDKNILGESMFRFSLGFSLSDLWFIKRKYD